MSMFRLRLWFLTRALSLLHTRLRVQPNTRHSLRPLLSEDVGSCKTRTRRVAGMLARNLTPHTPRHSRMRAKHAGSESITAAGGYALRRFGGLRPGEARIASVDGSRRPGMTSIRLTPLQTNSYRL